MRDLSIKWNDAAIPWRDIDSTVDDIYLAEDRHSCHSIEQEMRMTDTLYAKYKKPISTRLPLAPLIWRLAN
jgi:hypothetical protein